MSGYLVYLGATGWEHEAWRGDFYPEDMPEDWQLSFYNTQFRCVYLPYEQWRNAADDVVAGWLYDTHESFHFVLEMPECLKEGEALKARRFGERGQPENAVNVFRFAGEPDLRDLARRMQMAVQTGVPLYLISQDGVLSQLRKVAELMGVLGV